MLPARMKPRINCKIPAMIPAQRNNSKAPRSVMATRTIAVKPAAGPETEMLELLMQPTTIPPTIPAMIPDKGGAPDAKAIPRQSGNATRKTTRPEGKFSLIPPIKDFDFCIIIEQKSLVKTTNYSKKNVD